MRKQSKKSPNEPSLASLETDIFGALAEFHAKTTTLVRQSSLDKEKLNAVADRIKTLLDQAIAEMKETQQMNLAERLDAIYEEIKRFVEE